MLKVTRISAPGWLALPATDIYPLSNSNRRKPCISRQRRNYGTAGFSGLETCNFQPGLYVIVIRRSISGGGGRGEQIIGTHDGVPLAAQCRVVVRLRRPSRAFTTSAWEQAESNQPRRGPATARGRRNNSWSMSTPHAVGARPGHRRVCRADTARQQGMEIGISHDDQVSSILFWHPK